MLGLLVGLGDDDRARLAVVVDLIPLQREEALARSGSTGKRGQEVRLAGDVGGVFVGQYSDDAIGSQSGAAVDGGDPSAGNRRADDRGVGQVGKEDLAR